MNASTAGSSPSIVSLDVCATVHPGQHILENAYNRQGDGIGYLTGPADFGDISPIICRWTNEPKAWSLPGDVLITVKGAGVGKSNLAPDCKVAIGRQLMAIRPRHGLDQHYLFFFLQHVFEDFQEAALGATVPGLGRSGIESLEIPLPPLVEQERIAARLTEQLAAVERARAAALARLAAAEALPAAYYREAFGDVAPFSAAPLPPQEPTQPGWHWHLLTKLARLATGHTPSRREATYWGGEIPWLQLPDIRAVDGRRVLETSEHTNSVGIENSSSVLLPGGTVCMSRTASVGFVTIMGRPMATSQDFVNWICGPDLDPDFLMLALIRSRKEIRDLGSGATHHSIYFQSVLAFSVCVPDITKQRRIAADLSHRLAETDRLSAVVRDELAAIEALPAALLRDAFNGND
jgi:type I restriction enzyme, S subunit